MIGGTPEIDSLITSALESHALNMRVAGIGIVKSYDAAKQTCDVQPAVRRPIETEDGAVSFEEDPIVQNVIVAQWGAAAFSSHVVLTSGDAVLLVYLDYSPVGWRKNGKVSDAGDTQKNGPSYPIAVPFYRPAGGAGADTDDSIGKPGGLRLHFGTSAISAGGGADFVAMAAKVNARLDALEQHAAAHTHATAGLGAPSPGVPPFAAGGGPVDSANLKAD